MRVALAAPDQNMVAGDLSIAFRLNEGITSSYMNCGFMYPRYSVPSTYSPSMDLAT